MPAGETDYFVSQFKRLEYGCVIERTVGGEIGTPPQQLAKRFNRLLLLLLFQETSYAYLVDHDRLASICLAKLLLPS